MVKPRRLKNQPSPENGGTFNFSVDGDKWTFQRLAGKFLTEISKKGRCDVQIFDDKIRVNTSGELPIMEAVTVARRAKEVPVMVAYSFNDEDNKTMYSSRFCGKEIQHFAPVKIESSLTEV